MEALSIDSTRVRDISPYLLDELGRPRLGAASDLAQTTAQERFLFGVRHGVYSFPTHELRTFLSNRIAGRSAIEIGAGNGVLAAALGIPATDNRQQEEPEFKAYYARLRQPTIVYGDHVEKLDATSAAAKYRPQVVVACWVTHRYREDRHEAEGSMTGIDEEALLDACDEYIFIGNEHVHARKPILQRPHEALTPPWLYSRAINGSRDFIAIWRRQTETR